MQVEALRWSRRRIELSELIPRGEVFEISDSERTEAITEIGAHMTQLLTIVSQITRGEWHHLIDSKDGS